MADIPQARSYNQILNDIISAFLSRFGISSLKVGSPLLSILEAAAQSDLRSSQDIFNLLDAQSIERANGLALDLLAADEGLLRIPVTASTGFVNFYDESFNKIATTLDAGGPIPTIGTTTLRVADASDFANSGRIFIGRGTANYEGPISYSAKAQFAGYWTLTLSSGTTKIHNLTESVILGQGGTRQISSGTIVQTPQGNVSEAVKFSTIYTVEIDDGEDTLENVEVVAQAPGIIGNVPANTIRELESQPYVGASVNNVLPFTNGASAESDNDLRERIKNAIRSRTKGTAIAITSGVIGVVSPEDSKTVLSASIVNEQDKSIVFIDDGTGYEESFTGVAYETLIENAIGGEKFFELSSPKPITKANLVSANSSPYNLGAGDILAVKVGGVLSEHSFSSSEFTSIGNATAYEVVASINGNPDLLFSAKTTENASKVVLYAKEDTNEDLEVVTPGADDDANLAFIFPVKKAYTLRLYKNDEFLYKDGKAAIIDSNLQSLWNPGIVSGDTLQIAVDSTATQTITILDSDFVDNDTGYTTVNSTNSLASWATVLTSKIAGATVTASSGKLFITSNKGNKSTAKIEIVSGTLVTKSMFRAGSDTGLNQDFTLNRYTGQIKLIQELSAGDSLTVATDYTRGYVQSDEFASGAVTLAGTASVWLAVDGAAEVLNTGISAGTTLTISNPAGAIARYTGTNNMLGSSSDPYIQIGDFVIIWDTNFTDLGTFRVSNLDTVNYAWFEVERSVITIEAPQPLDNGIVFVRSSKPPQLVQVGAGVNIPLSTVATTINDANVGATASVYRNRYLRISTNTYDTYGDINILTADIEGQKLALPTALLKTSNPSHVAVVESGNSEVGSCNFHWTTVATTPSPSTFTVADPLAVTETDPQSNGFIVYKKRLDTLTENRYGNNKDNYQKMEAISTGTFTARSSASINERLVSDRLFFAEPFATSPYDTLNVILDKDDLKNYSINLYRQIKPNPGATYGAAAFAVLDLDNGSAILTDAFGQSTTFFNDFALYMKARGKSHSTTANKTILFRYGRYGAGGTGATVVFVNPSAPSTGMTLTQSMDNGKANVDISLPSGAERTGLNINGSNFWYVNSRTQYWAAGANIARAAGIVTVTLESSVIQNIHNLKTGEIVYKTDDEANFPAGPKTVSATTANTFSYVEAGAAVAGTVDSYFYTQDRPAGTTNTVTALSSDAPGTTVTATVGAHFWQAGDVVYFEPGHYDSAIGVVDWGAKTLTSVAATTVSWSEVVSPAAVATLNPAVTYTISSGYCYKTTYTYFKQYVDVGQLVRNASGVVTANITTSALLTSCPFNVGDIVYLGPGEANFPSGPKIITSSTGTTFAYLEAGAAVASGAIQGFSTSSIDPNLTGGGTPAIVGDIAHIADMPDWPTYSDNTNRRVFEVSSTSFAVLMNEEPEPSDTFPRKLVSSSNLRFSPIDTANSKASDINTFVNASGGDIISSILVPHNGGGATTGAAVINTATREEFFLTTANASFNGTGSISVEAFPLFDGYKVVRATNLNLVNSTISLKTTVSGELTSNADFDNEVMRLSPLTAQNMVDYLNTDSVSGFGQTGTVVASNSGGKVQFVTDLLGSEGSVRVVGGTGNLASVSVTGNGTEVTNNVTLAKYAKTKALKSLCDGFVHHSWVSLQNSVAMPKATPIDDLTNITGVASGSESLITTSVNIVDLIATTTSTSHKYLIEKHHHEHVAYVDISAAPLSLANVSPGDYVTINSSLLSSINTGTFQIVAVDASKNTFWVENEQAIEETSLVISDPTSEGVYFFGKNSVMPGDKFIIGSTVWGTTGEFVVSRLNLPATTSFYVSGVAVGSLTPLVSEYTQFTLKEASPSKLIKRIYAIGINPEDSSYLDISLEPYNYASSISESAGTVMKALNKLEFDTSLVEGLDGYKRNTGLLSEVTKVIYGDEANSSVYPGIAAAGANIQVSGPFIQRVAVSLALRLRTGLSAKNVTDRVKNIVAATINNTDVGESVALSDIIAAANAVDGVLSVVILSPTFNSSNDLIPIQPHEKARILDIDTDILISILS